MATIINGTTFNAANDFVYTKAKVNANGRKQVGILNQSNKKSLYLSSPLMLTWGVNVYEDDATGRKTYDMALQFPNDEYNNPECTEFLKNMQQFEQQIKEDAVKNSKDWLNKTKLVPEAVDALWTPMLKYPKDKDTGEPDYSRPPTLKIKIPFWEGEFKNVELYNDSKELIFPMEDSDVEITELIAKATNVATLIQCGGIWVANGKFGVTWKLFQAVVKPRTSLSGKCHIELSQKEREKLNSAADNDNSDDESAPVSRESNVRVQDSEDEDEEAEIVENTKKMAQAEIKEVVEAKTVATEDVPKKKRVVKKKAVAED
jgi:hypothetical protein